MNKGPMCILAFAFGAAAGSVAAWRLLEEKYRRIAQEEIDSMANYYAEKYCDEDSESEEVKENKELPPLTEKPDIREYAAKLQKEHYINYSNKPSNTIDAGELEVKGMIQKPYVIAPEEYGELADYDQETLNYFADGVLADDQNIPIEDTDSVVGENFEDHFGDYEDDAVHIRNDREQTDYEILLDPRKFSDVVKRTLHPAEDE